MVKKLNIKDREAAQNVLESLKKHYGTNWEVQKPNELGIAIPLNGTKHSGVFFLLGKDITSMMKKSHRVRVCTKGGF